MKRSAATRASLVATLFGLTVARAAQAETPCELLTPAAAQAVLGGNVVVTAISTDLNCTYEGKDGAKLILEVRPAPDDAVEQLRGRAAGVVRDEPELMVPAYSEQEPTSFRVVAAWKGQLVRLTLAGRPPTDADQTGVRALAVQALRGLAGPA